MPRMSPRPSRRPTRTGGSGDISPRFFFAAGTERRMAGDEQGAKTFFGECASLTNPLVEYEWYLAKSEASVSS